MALEKYFLERGKDFESGTLSSLLLYLLQNSISASISAVVSSIVMAFPDKTFDVAQILFQTKDFIILDKNRQVVDNVEIKSFYSMGYDLDFNNINKIFRDERIATCDHKHRQFSLEHRQFSLEDQFRFYQLFTHKEMPEEKFTKRQEILWIILDNYYKELSNKSIETKDEKTWRLFLARMDMRKTNITTEKAENATLIYFTPDLEPDLKEYSEKSIVENISSMKYMEIKLWAKSKIDNNTLKCQEYEKYENDPLLALQEVKYIVEKLESEEKNSYPLDYGIVACVCSCLIEYYYDELSNEDKIFCKNIALKVSSSFRNSNYLYQISDGVEPSILVLPKLLKSFPENKQDIKLTLFLALFEKYSISLTESFNKFPLTAIHKLWMNNFEDANSFLLAYLLLKPSYDELNIETKDQNYRQGIYYFDKDIFTEKFITTNKEIIEDFVENRLKLSMIEYIEELKLEILGTAFQILPFKIENTEQKKIAKQIIYTFARKIKSNHNQDKIDYRLKRDFLRKYVYIVLNLSINEINDFLIPFVNDFTPSDSIADLFQEFILAEDNLKTNDQFWFVWNTFKQKIFEISQDRHQIWCVSKTIKSYLFAQTHWKDNAKEWYSLTEKNKKFFKEVSEKIGHCPSTLYCIAKLLNDIGSIYLDDGIDWIANILSMNSDYTNKDIETNTIFHIENFVRKFSFRNREKIRRTKLIKNKLLIVLDFLVQKGSAIGYMVRELVI